MAISQGNEALASDMNTINTNVINTYKKYGFNGSTTTLTAGVSPIDDAYLLNMIKQINSCINDTEDRRKYYYTGGVLPTTIEFLQAAQVSNLSTIQGQVSNDYCSCHSNCCVSDCCHSDCSCDWDRCGFDCCNYDDYEFCIETGCSNCRCDSDNFCNCDSDGCGQDCCNYAGDCIHNGCCEGDCYDCPCESDGCGYDGGCCDADCCDSECQCDSVCSDCDDCCEANGCGQDFDY